MKAQQVLHTSSIGTQVKFLNSLEEIAGCSLKEIEVHARIPQGGDPRIIILEKKPDEIIEWALGHTKN